MQEVSVSRAAADLHVESLRAALATVLELPLDAVPDLPHDDEAAMGRFVSRWLGGLGLGLVPVAEPSAFSWPGPWLARLRPPGEPPRFVVMYGVPSGLVWDPAGDGSFAPQWLADGFVVAASDIALARPPRPEPPAGRGMVEGLYVAASAGAPAQRLDEARAQPGRGLDGDRHVNGTGTFPSGVPGSALTLIEAEVCESFDPPLEPGEHRRNVVTRGVGLNGLVGREFTIGDVRCRGMRLCEPCTVVDGYASRPVLRALVHRGGLRADILEDGVVRVGDPVEVATD